jgi:anti-anti-sigma factor
MDRRNSVSSFGAGDPVEVVTHFTGAWVGGFEVASILADGCSIRRVSDGAVLPTLFGYDDVRPAPPRRDFDRDRDSAPVAPIHEDQSDSHVVVRLPADLDIATVESIRDAVMDAVGEARGEVVLDLEGVRFLDSYGIRLLVMVRRRAWERDLPVRLQGGKPLIRDLLDLVALDPMYHPELPAAPLEVGDRAQVDGWRASSH